MTEKREGEEVSRIRLKYGQRINNSGRSQEIIRCYSMKGRAVGVAV